MPLKKQFRHEYKYLITPHEYFVLRARLAPLMHVDKHAKSSEGYHIRSLYFDDAYDSSLYEKDAGVYRREKFRIRIYDKSNSIIKLERKGKSGNHIDKESSSLTTKEYYRILNGNCKFLSQSEEDPLKKLFFSRMRTNLLKPAIITDYFREPFTYPVSEVRVTFDKKISTVAGSLDIFAFDNHVDVPSEVYDMVVLEVKFNNFLPDIIRDQLFVGSSALAVSKYVLCRMAVEQYNLKGC